MSLGHLCPWMCVFLPLLFYQCSSYEGQNFPKQYLEVEEMKATSKQLDFYLNSLAKTVDFFALYPNDTDINKALGSMMTQVILRRALLDDGHKLTAEQRTLMNTLIRKADFVVSHHVYDDQFTRGEDMTYETFRMTQNFREHEILTHSLPALNKGRMKRWIMGKGDIHEYIQEMDEASLPKEKYVALIDESYVDYFIKIEDSDTCLSRIIYNISPDPKDTEFHPCRHDPYCHKNMHTSPSIAYGLSHRMLNLWYYRTLKHCYWVSPQADELHLDILCSFMYREAVYIARKGYFARDLFLEHIALCAMLGYEEFYRANWFRKAITWIDGQGCIQEDTNMDINRTAVFISMETDEEVIQSLRTSLRDRMSDPCHIHPMALLTAVLSHAVRYTAYLLTMCVVLSQITSLRYAGEEFPVKYLKPDGIVPSRSDLELYLDTLMRMCKYLIRNANETDVNQALAAYMSSAILKRTLQDYSSKLEPYKKDIKFMINGLGHVIAHYRYGTNNGRLTNPEYAMARAVEDYTALVHSLRKFNKGLIKPWLLQYNPINNFTLAMDNLSLKKERYVYLVEDIYGPYEIHGATSDVCLTRLVENIDVLDNTTLHPCKMDELCKTKIFSAPSVAYSLTHRLLNNMMYYYARRCYHHSPSYDVSHMDMLCAAMYREAVYLARRGYFYRDMFMEHVAFCGQLGYVEFHRRAWFHKTAQWIDNSGCMQENENFELNRTKLIVSSIDDPKEVKKIWRKYQELINEDCHLHQMALALMVISTAVRHAAHFMEDPTDNLV